MYTHAYIQESRDSHVILGRIFVQADDREVLDVDFSASCSKEACFSVGSCINQDHWGFPEVLLRVLKVENRLPRSHTE